MDIERIKSVTSCIFGDNMRSLLDEIGNPMWKNGGKETIDVFMKSFVVYGGTLEEVCDFIKTHIEIEMSERTKDFVTKTADAGKFLVESIERGFLSKPRKGNSSKYDRSIYETFPYTILYWYVSDFYIVVDLRKVKDMDNRIHGTMCNESVLACAVSRYKRRKRK